MARTSGTLPAVTAGGGHSESGRYTVEEARLPRGSESAPSATSARRRGFGAAALALALVFGACGGGGSDGSGDPASDTTLPASLAGVVDDLEAATQGMTSEEAAKAAVAIQQVIQEIIAEAVARAGNPMSDEELSALFRQKMAEAGVPLPE